MIGDAFEPRADRARDIGRESDRDVRHLCLGALGLDRAVEKQLDLAVGRDDRDAVPFEDAEVRRVAQVIALPRIAVEHHLGDTGLRHGGEQAAAALVPQHGHSDASLRAKP